MQKDDRHSWLRHFSMIIALRQWQQNVQSFPILETTTGDVTAYVANFKRPQNIRPIVRSLLACPSIGRIIVSNNNPDCDLQRWFEPENDRVTVLMHEHPQSCSMRYIHLRDISSPFYIILDDDVFPLPAQIERLISELKNDPSVPHGLYGQRWDGEKFRGGFEQIDDRLEVISRVYAFSEDHLRGVFRVSAAVGIPEGHPDWQLSRFDDLFLSCSGVGSPRIHKTGAIVDCPTQGKKGVATWREAEFHRQRNDMYRKLLALRS